MLSSFKYCNFNGTKGKIIYQQRNFGGNKILRSNIGIHEPTQREVQVSQEGAESLRHQSAPPDNVAQEEGKSFSMKNKNTDDSKLKIENFTTKKGLQQEELRTKDVLYSQAESEKREMEASMGEQMQKKMGLEDNVAKKQPEVKEELKR